MKLKEVLFLSFTVFSIQLIVPAAEPISPENPRYNFAPGSTNLYNVQIENQGESGREMLESTYFITARTVNGGFTELTFRGHLRTKPVPMGRFPHLVLPNSPSSLSSYAMRPGGEEMNLTIDERGNVVRAAGEIPLPVPLGELMSSLVERFPKEPANAWESERDVYIADDPFVQGPASEFASSPFGYGYAPGRSGLATLSATLKTKLQIASTTNDSITLHKELDLDSRMMTGSERRVSATSEGEIVFDKNAGLPKNIELRCKTVVLTENVSRRYSITLRWRLLEGDEREAAINPPPPPASSPSLESSDSTHPGRSEPPDVSAAEQSRIMKGLKSEDRNEREIYARQLTYARITSPSEEMMSLVQQLVDDSDDVVRSAALLFLAKHGTQDHVALLLKAMPSADASLRTAIYQALGRLKDRRGIELLTEAVAAGPIDQLQSNSRNTEAADALAKIGPAAESAVLALLKEKNFATRYQACGILKHIGTEKSLPALKDLSVGSNRELSEAAADAYRAIQAREGK